VAVLAVFALTRLLPPWQAAAAPGPVAGIHAVCSRRIRGGAGIGGQPAQRHPRPR
jgi:hypothetical protein